MSLEKSPYGDVLTDGKADIVLFQKKLNLVELEKRFLELDQVETPLEHKFAEGVYLRELHIPKDTVLIGKRHRLETMNILLEGEISIYMGEDLPVKNLKAPCIFNSKPGVKKLGYTKEGCIFANIHPTKETDLGKIEEQFIIPEEEYNKIEVNKCLG